MAAVLKQPTDIARVTGTVQNQLMSKNIQTGFVVIGRNLSTGSSFQRAFPNFTAAQQFLSQAAGADVEVDRCEPCTFVA